MRPLYNIPNLGEVPSVTTITKQLDKSGPLVGWAKKVMGKYLLSHRDDFPKDAEGVIKLAKQESRRLSEEALEIGSNVHNCVEVHLKGHGVDGLLQGDPRIVKPYNAFLEWEKSNDFKLIEAEHKVWSLKHKFAGTLDIVGRVAGRLYIVDLKTSASIYPEYLLQVAAYKLAYEEMTNKDLEGVGILRLDKGGAGSEWRPYTLEETRAAALRFLKLLDYWWLDKGEQHG